MTGLRRTVFARAALTFALLAGGLSNALAAAPCPRHVQSVLLSRQYDDCLAHLGAQPTADASLAPFPFTAANAHALHGSTACSRALTELLAVAPETPCEAQLSDSGDHNQRVLLEAEQLHWIANHPSSPASAVARRLGSGGSTIYHLRYSCHFETKQPFTADSDMTEDFIVLCRENMLVEYPSFWTWLGYIVLGIIGVILLLVLCAYGVDAAKGLCRRTKHSSFTSMNAL